MSDAPQDPRLFACSNATGSFRVEEVPNFAQSDLVDDDVMLLDTYSQVFVWIGGGALESEKREARKTAIKYVKAAAEADGRDAASCCVLEITAGSEPPLFTAWFLGWDQDAASRNAFQDPYEARLQRLRAEQEARKPAAEEAPKPPPAKVVAAVADGTTFALAELQKGTPAGVDPARKEEFLSDEDFQGVFGKSKEEFAGMPTWKKRSAKQKAGLF